MALTPAQKQAAYRERELGRRAAAAESEREALAAAAALTQNARIDLIVGKSKSRTLPISEDAYVKLMLSEPHILDRKRAERYARWRYRGVVKGEVASL